MKFCSKSTCQQQNPQPLNEFYVNNANSDKLSCSCKSCHTKYRSKTEYIKSRKTYSQKWRALSKDNIKGNALRKYWPGSTWKEALTNFNDLVIVQNNVCALCKKPEGAIDGKTGLVRDLSVDHCHATKIVRGLLCSTCNRGLGYLKDNPLLCFAAGHYLLAHGQT